VERRGWGLAFCTSTVVSSHSPASGAPRTFVAYTTTEPQSLIRAGFGGRCHCGCRQRVASEGVVWAGITCTVTMSPSFDPAIDTLLFRMPTRVHPSSQSLLSCTAARPLFGTRIRRPTIWPHGFHVFERSSLADFTSLFQLRPRTLPKAKSCSEDDVQQIPCPQRITLIQIVVSVFIHLRPV